jgi:large subunit ribosomal protein L6
MSRIGKRPIDIPDGVTVDIGDTSLKVKGPKGELTHDLPVSVELSVEDGKIVVHRLSDDRKHGAFQGLARALIANMVEGVTAGFERKLQVEGVGHRVSLEGKKLVFNIGYSQPVEFDLPGGIDAEVGDKGLVLSIKGIDKCLVGQTAATLRGFRPPEPYKGKGIRYVGEIVRRKAGKAGVK